MSTVAAFLNQALQGAHASRTQSIAVACIVTGLLLFAIAAGLWLRQSRRLRQQQQRLRARRQDEFRTSSLEEMRGLAAAVVAMGRQLDALRADIAAERKFGSRLACAPPAAYQYAAQLLRDGASEAQLIERCDLTRSEAAWLQQIHAADKEV